MNNFLTIDNVLSDIEVELIQGAVSRDDLGPGLQAVRQHHNQLRTKLFSGDPAKLDLRDLASRQFQVNDMLLTLLQESIAKVQTLQLEVRKAARLTLRATASATDQGRQPSEDVDNWAELASNPTLPDEDDSQLYTQFNAPLNVTAQSIEAFMRADRLKLKTSVQPVRLPLIGDWLGRLRNALHSLTLFYTNRLGEEQSQVNQGYGEWLLHLYAQNQEQQAELRTLSAQVQRLQRQLAPTPTPTTAPGVEQ